ncbi:hypothetical protein [Sinorhizobium meliloti]|uniref:hypothetical protein n=1 Tax=Rhizobium meliloti TaxID=382 RepID=UPI000FD7B8B0|nr:hypothetical protein [Sinorhizobium meliloti]MDW9528070.1 hypothetical protein [Sinorhizobium meliloti]RVG88672.1 hypothetical protein CN219_03635 [Sinorhizobium meliloti]RVI39046.1 hypothetical protein CN197_02600 [Sinorhizobium meliloti]RVI46681.1 hypothetical protein CN196_09450 [Sinorhizobium meliloti]RVJ25683.1 hypothetical protein CN177_13490 [Sinorhizobium meliloti]
MSKPAKLSGGRFQQADYSIGRYAARPPSGTTLEDVMHPEYFQNELNALKPGMLINVLSDDFALDCDVRVLTVTKTTAKVRLIRLYQEGEAPKVESGDVTDALVTWGGPNHKWRVIHNGTVIEHGFSTQEEAEAAAARYRAALKG